MGLVLRSRPMSNYWRYTIVLWLASALAGTLSGFHVALIKTLTELEPVFVGLGSVALAFFTWRLWLSTAALWKHTRTVERAYVKMSHTSPPGVSFANLTAFASFEIRNAGNTPATVTDVIVGPIVLPAGTNLPAEPHYEVEKGKGCLSVRAFLVAGDHVIIDTKFPLPESKAIQAKSMTLYFVGYVDYIDAFDTRHRSGYARKYDPRREADRVPNNLVFVPERAYHYDRRRTRDEGNDWNQE